MITFSSKYRSNQTEIMDNFSLQGEEMQDLMTDLQRVNKWLGGIRVTLDGVERLCANIPKNETITILDVGCGDGEMLRNCEKWAQKNSRTINLIGVDANPNILREAVARSEAVKNSTFKVVDVFSKTAELPNFDIALCTLFLHHFKESQIIDLLHRLNEKAQLGIVVNDLHRSRFAFWLFKLFAALFIKTKIAKHDGLVSVARGFNRKDLKRIATYIPGHHDIRWKWAFRYQWVVEKENKVQSNIE